MSAVRMTGKNQVRSGKSLTESIIWLMVSYDDVFGMIKLFGEKLRILPVPV